MIALLLPLPAVLGFCALCLGVVTVLGVSAVADWVRLRREEREEARLRADWEWLTEIGMTRESFEQWRAKRR